MEHSEPEKYAHEACEHGMCRGHTPEWKNMGERQFARYAPLPPVTPRWWHLFFPPIAYDPPSCCNRPMIRGSLMQDQQCKKCRRTRSRVLKEGVYACTCCMRMLGGAVGPTPPPPPPEDEYLDSPSPPLPPPPDPSMNPHIGFRSPA